MKISLIIELLLSIVSQQVCNQVFASYQSFFSKRKSDKFGGCTFLTSIPQDLFRYNTNVSTFDGCFIGFISVTSNVPELWISHPNAKGTHCFYDIRKTSNYASIPQMEILTFK